MNKDYEQRVINLLKKADSVAGTPEETAFRAKAMELIAKYNFDAASLRDKSQGKAEIITWEVRPKGHHIKSQIMLYTVLSKNHSAIPIQVMGTESVLIRIYGTEDSISQIKWLFSILWPSALSQALAVRPDWHPYTKGDVTVARRSFFYGFISEINERLKEANDHAEEEDHGAGLVLMDDFRRAQEKVNQDFPNAKTMKSSRQVNEEAMANGRSAGRRTDIGQTRIKNTTRAIGA